MPDIVRTRLVNPNSVTLTLVLSALAVAVNVLGGTAVGLLHIPFLFLDTLGTFFIAASFGIRWGVLVGVLTNVILGVTTSPTNIPFAIVNAVVAIIVGLLANKWGYKLWVAIVAGITVGIVAPVIGSVIAVYVFGGLTGGGIDVFVLGLRQAGSSIFVSAFLPRLGENLIDKILTSLIVYAVLRAIPPVLIKPRRREPVTQSAEALVSSTPNPVA
ncbi:CD3073 family putative ECF transporter S component [Plantibacter sp. Mn2098]|uniref:CD3073 family putative ECF transporter S component n=1 Tax=Plantibacter sp. Mn2098 TaxID=3395266 RepID=UPI003BD3E57E